MSAIDDRPFPKPALYAAGVVLAIAIVAAGAPRLGLSEPPRTSMQARAETGVAVVATRDFRFLDRPDGTVAVRDAGTGAVVAILRPGMNQGFVRGVMRSLARDRRARGLGAETPFRLTLWRDRGLSLEDRATGRVIELGAFGPANRDAFARLLSGAA